MILETQGQPSSPEEEQPPAHTHSYTWTTVAEATCTQAGERQGVCACGETISETIAATGHTVVEDAAVEATCTEAGKTAGTHCSVCGEVLTAQTEIAALDHDFSAGYSAANSDENEHWQVCSRCGQIGNRAAHTPPADGQYSQNYLQHSWTCPDCQAVVSKQHSFSLSDHTCADCAYIAPVYVWFSDNMLPAIYYSDAADPNSWYINATLLAINVDTTRVTDVDLEIIPGEGWENRADPSVNKGSLGSGGTVNLPASFSIKPTDPAALTP